MIIEFPNNYQNYFQKGQEAFRNKNYRQALDYLKHSLDLEYSPQAFNLYLQTLVQLDDNQGIRRAVEELFEKENPENVPGRFLAIYVHALYQTHQVAKIKNLYEDLHESVTFDLTEQGDEFQSLMEVLGYWEDFQDQTITDALLAEPEEAGEYELRDVQGAINNFENLSLTDQNLLITSVLEFSDQDLNQALGRLLTQDLDPFHRSDLINEGVKRGLKGLYHINHDLAGSRDVDLTKIAPLDTYLATFQKLIDERSDLDTVTVNYLDQSLRLYAILMYPFESALIEDQESWLDFLLAGLRGEDRSGFPEAYQALKDKLDRFIASLSSRFFDPS